MDQNTLTELDRILKPVIERCYLGAKWSSHNGIPSEALLLERFRMELDHTKVALSNQLYKIDQLIQPPMPDQQFYGQFGINKGPKVDTKKYVQETSNGYKVFDGYKWTTLSKKAQIELRIEQNPSGFDNKIVIVLRAYDPESSIRISYIDDRTIAAQQAKQLKTNSSRQSLLSTMDVTWTDPLMGVTKSSVGVIGKTAGVLNAYTMMQHYQHGIRNPFSNKFISGQWRSLDGKWYKLQELEEATGFRKGSLKTSHRYAKIRGDKATPFPKAVGKICFGISLGISGMNVADALMNDVSNKNDVIVKSGVDVAFGIVAFVPGFGWAISGAYFLLDAGGAFGNWRQSSEFSRAEVDRMIANDRMQARQRLEQMNFEIDYSPAKKSQNKGCHSIQRDKTYVTPRTIFKTFH